MTEPTCNTPDEIHELEHLPTILHAMAESWIGNCGSSLPFRLRRSARIAEKGSSHVPKLGPVASELFEAAEAIETADDPPRLNHLQNLLKLPVAKEFVAGIPEDSLDHWHHLNGEIAAVKTHMKIFRSASWARVRGPEALMTWARRLRGDEDLAEDCALLAVNSARLADAELMLAGMSLLTVSRLLSRLMEVLIPLFFICDSSDACELGGFTNCEAGDMFFPPYQDSPADVEDADDAIDLLKGAGWLLPAKYLTPGGKKMIKEIADMLKKIKNRVDKKKIRLEGYGVYVVLKYEECVDGMCGNYWAERTKVVKIDPPAGKKHQLGKGWKASAIEDLGKNKADTDRQMRQFKQLAEASCP